MTKENEKKGNPSLVWWDENWAAKDKARIEKKKPIPASDMKSWINKILEEGVNARIWYLRTDVIMRVKSLIVQDDSWEDLKNLGKRIQIIKEELGVDLGSQIIQEAIPEAEIELKKDGMTHKEIKAKLVMLIKQMGGKPVF